MPYFDRVIPPGQEGKVVLEMSTKNLKGKVSRGVRVVSNDPEESNLILRLKADVKMP